MKRIYHTWDKWECYPAGFYDNKPKDKTLTVDDCKKKYAEFLSDIPMFEAAMQSILLEWKHSCEHYLSNENMNRLAWLGQAAMCYANGIPSQFRGGFYLLTEEQQKKADESALKFLNKWLVKRGESSLTIEEAQSKTEANLY
ncbi:MAG: hypothetical protein WC197_09510 [Candidatus Gastranaerophilaceae bacterium]